MLFFFLPLAAIVLVAAYSAARPYPHAIRWKRYFTCGGGAAAAPFLCLGCSPVVAGLFVLLIPALLVWPLARQRMTTFLPFLAAAMLIAYGTASWFAAEELAAFSQLQQKYAFESLVDRVPQPQVSPRAPGTVDVAGLDKFEQTIQRQAGLGWRARELQRLHEGAVATFVNSPGFGVVRMAPLPSEMSLKDQSGRGETPSQPGSPSVWGHGDLFETVPPKNREDLSEMHMEGTLDFVNPWGWGYVKSRDRVAGFLSHRFSKVPEVKTWRVQRIELVGLLKHPEPVVYLSDRLPAMVELANAPTRSLDAFEGAGLSAVRAGEDGFAAHRGDVVRFVGAIRSAKQCVECHGGQRGDLLGAFSYTLLRDEMRP